MNVRLPNTSNKTVSKQKPYILVVRDINEGVAHKQYLIKQSPNDPLSEQSDEETDRVNLQNAQVAYYENKESDVPDTELIWSHKKSTEHDAQATEYFLQVRSEEKYKQLFADKKFSKFKLWMEIAKELNNAGFYVGDGREGAERCRQKFCNLEKSFLKYIRHIRSDTRNKREPPPYYEFMINLVDPDDRLYKLEQNAMLDSVRDSLQVELLTSNSKDNNIASSSKNNDSVEINNTDFCSDKPKKIKQHNEIISLLNKQHSEIMSVQREFLEKIDKHLTTQNEQRERMINCFLNSMNSSCECNTKKRKLDESENT